MRTWVDLTRTMISVSSCRRPSEHLETCLVLVVQQCPQFGARRFAAAACDGDLITDGTVVCAFENTIDLSRGVCDLVFLSSQLGCVVYLDSGRYSLPRLGLVRLA